MNTIPSIFNENVVYHTVIGGSKNSTNVLMNVTAVVLQRGARQFRNRVLENLDVMGFEKIISVESGSEQVLTEQLALQYPNVKFIVIPEQVSQGEMVNIAMAEAETPHVLVLQEEMCTQKFSFSPALAASMIEKNKFCICPRLLAPSFTKIPVKFFPTLYRLSFRIDSDDYYSDGDSTFYCADYAGFYDREKFIRLGGFDYTITSEYWQKVDLFFRGWLWGEETVMSSVFELKYSEDKPPEDSTVDKSFFRVYLKNIVPVFHNDHADILNRSFPAFKFCSHCELFEAIGLFKDAKRWTHENRYRFRKDAAMLISSWNKEEN